jgi:hypothetical protein
MDYKFKNLPGVIKEGKVINSNFGHISHLTGSKMIDNADILLDSKAQEKFTKCKRNKDDLVIITEKVDGMNAGVYKADNGLLYPINRKGYDARQMGTQYKELEFLGLVWSVWVDKHYEIYDKILEKGERLVFENCILQHTLKYNFKDTEPVFLLAKYNKDGNKVCFNDLAEIAIANNIETPPLLNIGSAIPPEIIINQYPKGKLGVSEMIEGIVYNYEHNGEHEACAKFVSNPIMGTINNIPSKYNNFKYRIFD